MAAGSFQFLHTADLHLDSALHGLVRYPGAPAERLRSATREAFQALVTEALERQVAFVIVAGDVFDGDWPDYNTGLFFAAEARRLVRAGIPMVLVRGNHDAESRVSRSLALPEGVHVFSNKAPETLRFEHLDVALHGQSYAVANVEENIARQYPPPVAGSLNIGVLHTGLEGYEGHGRYAPCTVADLVARGYDYWALGHIHRREVVQTAPWIVFPGNLQGRHAREVGPKGATLVHVEAGQVARLEELVLDVARWDRVTVALDGLADEADAMRAVGRALGAALAAADGRLLAARVVLSGATPLDARLRSARERLIGEVRNVAAGLSQDLWVEKVELATSSPVAPGPDEGFGALAARLAHATLPEDEAAELAREFGALATRLPERVAASLRLDDPAQLGVACSDAARYLAALLTAGPSDDKGATP